MKRTPVISVELRIVDGKPLCKFSNCPPQCFDPFRDFDFFGHQFFGFGRKRSLSLRMGFDEFEGRIETSFV